MANMLNNTEFPAKHAFASKAQGPGLPFRAGPGAGMGCFVRVWFVQGMGRVQGVASMPSVLPAVSV